MYEEKKELVRRYYADARAFPDLHVSVDGLIAEDERVFCRSTMTANGKE
jgi:hypothetical protein